MSIFFTSLFAQPISQSSGLTGRVLDVSTGLPLKGAFVEMRNKAETHLQTARSDSAGYFFLRLPPADIYTVSIMASGYLTYNQYITYSGRTDPDLGEYRLFPERVEMEEITVKISKILIRNEADKLVYSVEDDPQSKGSMLIQILKKIPGILVENNRDVTLNGNSNFLVLVNGRRSSLFVNDPSDIFRSFPASAVKQIEILSTPPSRYESEFIAGVINLVLDKYTIDGYRGSVNTQLSSPLAYTGSSYVTAKKGILGVNAYGSADMGRDPRSRSNEFIRDKVFGDVTRSTGSSKGNYSNGNYNTEFTILPDARNLVSITTSGRGDRGKSVDLSEIREILTGQTEEEFYTNRNKSVSSRSTSTIQADFEHRSKMQDKHLYTFSARRTGNSNFNRYDYVYGSLNSVITDKNITGKDDSFQENTLQGDYVYTFRKQNLEAGIKNIRRRSMSDYFQKVWDPESDLFYDIRENSNTFSFIQSIWGAYSSVNLRYKSVNLRAGFRAESVMLEVDFTSTQTNISKKYFNLIPNVRVSGRVKTYGRYNMAYTQRVQRPGLFYLNPFVNKSEVLYHYYGNPDLDPAVANVYTFNYSHIIGNTNLNFSGNHTSSSNSIQSYFYRGADSILYSTFANIGRYSNSGASLSMGRQFFDRISFNMGFSVRYNEYSGRRGGQEVINKGTIYSGNLHLGMPVRENGYLSGSANWNSGSIQLQGRNSGSLNTSFSFTWDARFNKNLTFDASVDNLFRKMLTSKYTSDTEHFYMVFNSYTQYRTISFSANYRFGQFKGVLKRKVRDIIIDDQVE